MPWYAPLAIVVVVWGVSRAHSPAVKAFIYSLPIPISIIIISTAPRITGVQLLGVGDLVLFFFVVAALRTRAKWHPLPSVLVGTAAYLAIAFLLRLLPVPPLLITLACLVVAWLAYAAVALVRGLPQPPAVKPERRSVASEIIRVVFLLVVTFIVVAVAGLLGGLAVTFPYSGVLVGFDLGPERGFTFARQFAFSSISLVAFLTAFALVQDQLGLWGSLGVGWGAFAVCAGILFLLRGIPSARIPGRPALTIRPE